MGPSRGNDRGPHLGACSRCLVLGPRLMLMVVLLANVCVLLLNGGGAIARTAPRRYEALSPAWLQGAHPAISAAALGCQYSDTTAAGVGTAQLTRPLCATVDPASPRAPESSGGSDKDVFPPRTAQHQTPVSSSTTGGTYTTSHLHIHMYYLYMYEVYAYIMCTIFATWAAKKVATADYTHLRMCVPCAHACAKRPWR